MPGDDSLSSLTPEDVIAMARRFDVDLAREPVLIPLMKEAAMTPSMPSNPHDVDHPPVREDEQYIRDQIVQLRSHSSDSNDANPCPTWMTFENSTSNVEIADKGQGSNTFYFDFATGTRQETHPLVRLVGEPSDEEQQESGVIVPAAVADPRVFAHAASIHRQPAMKEYVCES